MQQGGTLTASCYASTKFNHLGKDQFSQAMICLAISLRATLGPKNSISERWGAPNRIIQIR